MDIGRSFDFIRHDPRWLSKIVIGGLLFFVPIFGWFVVSGYFIRIIQRAAADIDAGMPEWDDWGGDFVRGFKLSVAHLAYIAPMLVLGFSWMIAAFYFALRDEFVYVYALQVVYFVFATPYSLALMFFSPLIMSRLAIHNRISAAFHFREILHEARRVWILLLVYVGAMYGMSMVAQIGILLCFVGILFTSFAGYVFIFHMAGQIRRVVDDPDADPRSVTFRVG
jgi:hypothetical protein